MVRACWDLGVPTVAVYSHVDRGAPHVRYADEAFCIGPPAAIDSYLNIPKIIEVARKTGAEAIHPGTGFLAESPDFAEACADAGLVFIGPSPETLRVLGNKIAAKALLEKTSVPVLPGTGPFDGSIVEAVHICETIGYPVIVKPASAGGGKGMRVVDDENHLATALERARSEARTSFGSDVIYLEKFLRDPRHIEIQILFDHHGHGIHLGERECSIQRRHQKIVEESPSPVVDAITRSRLGAMALEVARAADYRGAGTVEFLRDKEGHFYFIEVNARLQVEHTVTEQVFGVDLVQAQIRVAAGETLPWRQEDLTPRNHALEFRITAEDPERNFIPSPGKITAVRHPSGPGIREDSAVAPGFSIPLEYDPMVAKMITFGANRQEALRRMGRALDEYRLEGITTNIPFLRRLLEHPAFIAGDFDTGFLDRHLAGLISPTETHLEDIALLAAAIHAYRQRVEAAARRQESAGLSSRTSGWTQAGRSRALRGPR